MFGRAKARCTNVAPGFARGTRMAELTRPRRRPLQTHACSGRLRGRIPRATPVPRAKPGATFVERAFARKRHRGTDISCPQARCGVPSVARDDKSSFVHAFRMSRELEHR